MIGIAISALAVFQAVGNLNGMVGNKASKLKRLRLESDKATINLVSLIWRANPFPWCTSGKGESVIERGNAPIADHCRDRFRVGGAFVTESKRHAAENSEG